jgi:hypothetical protein
VAILKKMKETEFPYQDTYCLNAALRWHITNVDVGGINEGQDSQ